MKFFVNFLSAFRIGAAFFMIPALMFQWYKLALVLFVIAALTDFLDGMLARKYDVCTKIGGVLDHIGDKMLIVNTMIMLAIMMPVWFIVLPIILMVARELYVSGLREFLGTQKIEMPVPKKRFSMGKVKTALQMITVIAFLAMFAVSTMITPATISRTYLIAMNILSQTGIIGIWLALVASIWSATQYTHTFVQKLNSRK